MDTSGLARLRFQGSNSSMRLMGWSAMLVSTSRRLTENPLGGRTGHAPTEVQTSPVRSTTLIRTRKNWLSVSKQRLEINCFSFWRSTEAQGQPERIHLSPVQTAAALLVLFSSWPPTPATFETTNSMDTFLSSEHKPLSSQPRV